MQLLSPGVYWQDIEVGQQFRTLNRTVTETDIINFVSVTGMLEAIFIDHTFGEHTSGGISGTRYAPAALTYALIEGMICQTLIQGTGLAMLELHKKVLHPVHAGDTIHATITIDDLRPTSTGNRAVVGSTITVTNHHHTDVMTYQATRLLAGRNDQ